MISKHPLLLCLIFFPRKTGVSSIYLVIGISTTCSIIILSDHIAADIYLTFVYFTIQIFSRASRRLSTLYTRTARKVNLINYSLICELGAYQREVLHMMLYRKRNSDFNLFRTYAKTFLILKNAATLLLVQRASENSIYFFITFFFLGIITINKKVN